MQPVRIYTTPYCPFCRMAKRLLNSRSISFEERDVSDAEAREKIIEESGWPTVPVIYIGEKLIGGFEDLSALDRSGRLAELVGA